MGIISKISKLGKASCSDGCGPRHCGPVTDCDEFRQCMLEESDTSLMEFYAAVAGIVNNSCGSCASLNQTYIWSEPPFTSNCIISDPTIGPTICSATWGAGLIIGFVGAQWHISVSVNRGLSEQILFRLLGAPALAAINILCNGGGPVSLPFVSHTNSQCNGSSATCVLSSAPT